MNNQFDELTKSMAQSVTRRGALKKFGVGIASMALACLGVPNKAEAAVPCQHDKDCQHLPASFRCCHYFASLGGSFCYCSRPRF